MLYKYKENGGSVDYGDHCTVVSVIDEPQKCPFFNHFFDDQYFDIHFRQRWPLNEVAIPTLLRLLVGAEFPFASILIKTPQRKKLYTRKSIRKSLQSGDCFGLKKISLSPDDKIFRFVMKLQNKITDESC